MKKTNILRVAIANALTSLLIMLVAFVYLARVGIKEADHIFHKAEGVSMVFAVTALVFGARYSAIDWRDRPDKQSQLRILKVLSVASAIVGIPIALMNWFLG